MSYRYSGRQRRLFWVVRGKYHAILWHTFNTFRINFDYHWPQLSKAAFGKQNIYLKLGLEDNCIFLTIQFLNWMNLIISAFDGSNFLKKNTYIIAFYNILPLWNTRGFVLSWTVADVTELIKHSNYCKFCRAEMGLIKGCLNLVQIMARYMFGTKPLSEQMLAYW